MYELTKLNSPLVDRTRKEPMMMKSLGFILVYSNPSQIPAAAVAAAAL